MTDAKTRTARDLAAALGISEARARGLAHEFLDESYFVTRGKKQKALRADRFDDAVAELSRIRRSYTRSRAVNAEAKAERMKWEARRSWVRLQRETKQFIPADEVQYATNDAFLKLADELRNVPARIAPAMFEAESPAEMAAIAREAVREIFARFRVEACGLVLLDASELEPLRVDPDLN